MSNVFAASLSVAVIPLASCSLLFGVTSQAASDAGSEVGTDASAADERMLIEEDFETGTIGATWGMTFSAGDGCTVSSDVLAPNGGAYALKCRTDAEGDSRAAIYVDFDDIDGFQLDLDVQIANYPNAFLTFAQAFNVDGPEVRLFNLDFYPDNKIDVWNVEPQVSRNWDFNDIVIGRWYHLQLRGRVAAAPDGFIALNVDGLGEVGIYETNTLNASGQQINRIEIGISQLGESGPQSIYIDNVYAESRL